MPVSRRRKTAKRRTHSTHVGRNYNIVAGALLGTGEGKLARRQRKTECEKARREHNCCPHRYDVRVYSSDDDQDDDSGAEPRICDECQKVMWRVTFVNPEIADQLGQEMAAAGELGPATYDLYFKGLLG
jgi:hypothetical protein